MKDASTYKYSREIVTSILGILILILALFSTSYAVFVNSMEGERINTITTGYLSLNYTNKDTNIINMVDVMPISDEDGKISTEKNGMFEFSINNSSDDSIDYCIIIDEIASEIDSKYIKIYLTDDNDKPLLEKEASFLTDFEIMNDSLKRVIYTDKMMSKNKMFRLRVWVSDEYKEEKPVTFSFKVSVRGNI